MNNAVENFEQETLSIGPQEGPQTDFLASSADIVIFGGSAGGGKTVALLLETLRHTNNPKFGTVIFRKNSTQVRNEGGLWHESQNLFGPLGAYPRQAMLEWHFPKGMRVKFGHLEHETSVLDWQGSQIAYIGFDELTHFSEHQFFYMLSRNRSMSGVPGYVRATCNPDADSWVRKLIDWWIDKDGFPNKERAGVLRWFIRINDEIIWADNKEDIYKIYGKKPEILPKSLTFIPSSVYDNKILMDKDPNYIANLNALPRVERMRLLGGNWNVRLTAGTMFQREWFPVIDAIPAGWIDAVRYWDRGATKPHEGNKDPDWTRGLLMFKYPDNSFVVGDLKSIRDTPAMVENLVKNVASHDTNSIRVMSQVDPGSAGVAEADSFVRMLAGYIVKTERLTQNKATRAKPVSAQCEVGNIRVKRGAWNDEFFDELENFPEGTHDDIVDVLSGAFNAMTSNVSILDVL